MATGIALFQLVFLGVCLTLIVVLAVRRMEIKKNEDFEDRDN